MAKVLVVIGVVVALAVLVSFSVKSIFNPSSEQTVHYHAGFQVYKSNNLQDYSGLEYMHLAPCSEAEHEEEFSPDEEQLERAHLHDNTGDVVHVHREGATWGDLFGNIKVDVSPGEVYVNGQLLDADFLSYPIKAYDSVVVFEGESTNIEEKLTGSVTKEHIVEIEAKSESCGS